MENPYDDETLLVPPKNLQELIDELNKVFSRDKVNVEYVKALLSSYRTNPKDWKKFAHFDPHRYTRNLVDEGNGKYNLMALCWGEGQGSSIHDHADAHCFVKVLDGTLRETLFEWPKDSENESEMSKLGFSDYEKNGVAYINDEMGLHRMENPSHTDRAVTLHLYVPPFKSCKTFDEKTGHTNEVKMTFWSRYGKRTPFSTVVDKVHNVMGTHRHEKHPESAFPQAVESIVEAKRQDKWLQQFAGDNKDEEMEMELAVPENN